ncbi:MAG TPA: NAD(P)H-dependent oxidoreductase [Steroidobacteraceae bacterium]|jgi:NAD(P)H-dependent FMN reductase|nr:NAD(P)H-dependent oxidoreductase [Steroidobacteraceae bacterium]
MGSVRARRVCPQVAQWVVDLGHASAQLDIEIVDLQKWPLPMDDEPQIPATGIYSEPHTRAWSQKVRDVDAVIFVTPQYNWGYPAPLKNAIDHLYREWRDKPAMLVTYGGHGGTKCAQQLRQVLGAVKARLARARAARWRRPCRRGARPATRFRSARGRRARGLHAAGRPSGRTCPLSKASTC